MLAAMKRIVFSLVLVGCSNSSSPQVDGGGTIGTGPGTADGGTTLTDGGTSAPGGFKLTSAAFAEGGTFPAVNTCTGADTSPALAWTGAPAGAKSFALVLVDTTIGLNHWAIYDIPATATSLPADVENAAAPANVPGAHQLTSGATNPAKMNPVGFAGPCPPANKGAHTYQFALYPLPDATLPGVAGNTPIAMGVAQIKLDALQGGFTPATLTGNFSQ